MRIHLGANSDGYRAAEALRDRLSADGHEVHWHAAPVYDENDDYAAISIRAIQAVIADEDAGTLSRAVLVGGAGAGEVISANKVNGARVISATDSAVVVDARQRTDINGLAIPSFHVDAATIADLVAALFDTEFSNDLDDARRLVNVAEFESSGTIEGWLVEE